MEFGRERYLKQLLEREHNGLIKVITGMRRSGKSFLMNELFYRALIKKGVSDGQIIRFAFDMDEDIDLLEDYFPDEPTRVLNERNDYVVNARKFRAFIRDHTRDTEPYYLLLDEVQLLEGFTGTLNGFLRHRNLDVYVTGSNSRFLSSDIATEFKGRGSVIHVLPLSFREYCEGLQLEPIHAWPDYLETGGLPLVALMRSRSERMGYLKNLSEETYLKDIIQHHHIRKTAELGETLDIVASSIGSPVNVLRLTNTFKSVIKKEISDDTISNEISAQKLGEESSEPDMPLDSLVNSPLVQDAADNIAPYGDPDSVSIGIYLSDESTLVYECRLNKELEADAYNKYAAGLKAESDRLKDIFAKLAAELEEKTGKKTTIVILYSNNDGTPIFRREYK